MTLRSLPEIKAFHEPKGYSWDVPSDALARWSEISAAEADDANTISIYDVIGEDFWTGGGFTAKRMSAALRSIGAKDVTVKINSPGGNVFEGFTIYNQLREHPAKVTVEVMGIAASAASVIAMAGDDIRMGLGSFMMVHNAWGLVIGNRHDLTEASGVLEKIDGAMTDIYEARTGLARKELSALMDAETYLSAKEAVAKKFADSVTDKKVDAAASSGSVDRGLMARRQMEAALARAGHSRHARSEMIAALLESQSAARDAGQTAARDAGEFTAAVTRLITTLKK